MRVLYAAPARGIPLYGPSGASAHQRGVIAALVEAGHAVSVVAACVEDGRGRHGTLPDVEVVTAPEPGWPSWLSRFRERREAWHARRLARAVSGRFDLVWERWSLFSDLGARVRGATGARWILEVDAPLAEERARYEELFDPGWAEAWERRLLPQPDLVVAVSTWLVRWLVEQRGVPAGKVLLAPNGTALGHGDRAAGRALLEVGEEDLVVGFLGSMKPWHGADRLAGIVGRLPGAVGVAVGEGPVRPEGVRCLGAVDDPADLVAAMDVGLAPYPERAPPWFCPLKIADYRAEGTPVVASAIGDLPALVGSGGSTVPAGDDAAFAAACQRWRGRRATPQVRSWREVVEEVLAAG